MCRHKKRKEPRCTSKRRSCAAQALGFIYDKDIVKSLFNEAPGRYQDRNGGYCRVITEARARRGDAAEMAAIELV